MISGKKVPVTARIVCIAAVFLGAASALRGGVTWSPVGPPGGDLDFVASAPSRPETVYVSSNGGRCPRERRLRSDVAIGQLGADRLPNPVPGGFAERPSGRVRGRSRRRLPVDERGRVVDAARRWISGVADQRDRRRSRGRFHGLCGRHRRRARPVARRRCDMDVDRHRGHDRGGTERFSPSILRIRRPCTSPRSREACSGARTQGIPGPRPRRA